MDHVAELAAAGERRRAPAPTALVVAPVAWAVIAVGVGGYALLATALGSVDRLTGEVRAEWNPFDWEFAVLTDTIGAVFGGELGAIAARTALLVVATIATCLLVGVPVAEYVARRSGRARPLLLALLVLPLLVGATVRTVAVTGVFGNGGVAERAGALIGLGDRDWLAGHPSTVLIGLLYTALPMFVVITSVAIARIDQAMLIVARDLGARGWSYLFGAVVPLARRGIVAASSAVVALVVGDFWTARLLSYTAVERTPAATEMAPTEMLAGSLEELVATGAVDADLRAAAALAVVLAVPLGVGAWLRLRSVRRTRSAVA